MGKKLHITMVFIAYILKQAKHFIVIQLIDTVTFPLARELWHV